MVTTAARSGEKKFNITTESERNASAPEAPQPKTKRTKKTKPAKKAARANKSIGKPAAERSTKKAEVIAMMKRSSGSNFVPVSARLRSPAGCRSGAPPCAVS